MIDTALMEMAALGDASALNKIGNCYYDGTEGEENKYKSFGFFKKAVEIDSENVLAINNLANCFNFGIGTEKDKEKAAKLYKKASNLGSTVSQYNLAVTFEAEDNPECIPYFEKAVHGGDPDAAYKLAKIFYSGKITEKDTDKYIEYLELAHKLGSVEATIDLSTEYLNGELVETDIKKGISLMYEAAKNNKIAANNMAIIYSSGTYTKRNNDVALQWALRATDLGNGDCLANLAVDIFQGQNGFEKNANKAFGFFMKAAQAGTVSAMDNLGICYYKGLGVNADKTEAAFWLEKAARSGSEKSLDLIGPVLNEIAPVSAEKRYIDIICFVADNGNDNYLLKAFYYLSNSNSALCDYSKAMHYLETAFEKGIPEAVMRKGVCLSEGSAGYAKNVEEGINLFKKASDLGNGEASFRYAFCLRDGLGVEKNPEHALEMFEKASDQGIPNADLNLALAYYDNGFAGTDYEKAFNYFSKAHEHGISEAAFFLASMYKNGYYVQQDTAKSIELLKEASESGVVSAYINLGLEYLTEDSPFRNIQEGIDCLEKAIELGCDNSDDIRKMIALSYQAYEVETDPKKRFRYRLKEAESGNLDAQAYVSMCYMNGIGVEENDAESEKWMRIAAEGGHQKSQLAMAKLSVLKNDDRSAAYYFEKLLHTEDPDVYLSLGRIYLFSGNNMLRNEAKGFELIGSLAKSGNDEAQVIIGNCYYQGNAVPRNVEMALRFYNMAAEKGNADAQFIIGSIYCIGDSIPVNYSASVFWLNKASENGNLMAKRLLALIYSRDDTGFKDYNKALTLFNEVIDSGESEFLSEALLETAKIYDELGYKDNAFGFFESAAKRGDMAAEYYLGMYYYYGWHVFPDRNKAIAILQRSANQGEQRAIQALNNIENGLSSGAGTVYSNQGDKPEKTSEITKVKKSNTLNIVLVVLLVILIVIAALIGVVIFNGDFLSIEDSIREAFSAKTADFCINYLR